MLIFASNFNCFFLVGGAGLVAGASYSANLAVFEPGMFLTIADRIYLEKN